MRVSEVIHAMTVRKKEGAKETPNDRPFNPSIRLKAWATPVVANTVNNTAKGDNRKSWSTKKTSTLVSQVFNNRIAIIDDIEAPINLKIGLILKYKSSRRPSKRTGIPDSII